MRPDAASFSPLNGNATTFDPYTAVVPHQKVTTNARETSSNFSDSASVKSTKETPHDMILHESIKGILQKLVDLEARCNGLEAANEELRSEVALLKADCDMNSNDHKHAMNITSRSVNGNLTGYESSSNGSERDFTGSSESAHQPSTEMRELKEKISMISEVLSDYEQRIAKQSTRTYELDQRFQRKDQTATWLQGRIGKLEKGVKELDQKVDECEANDHRGRALIKSGSTADVASFLMDEIQKTQMRVAEVEDRCTALATVVEGGSTEPVGREEQWELLAKNANKANRKGPFVSKEDVADLKAWQYEERRKAKKKQAIDEASTRDALDAMFFQLTHIMGKNSGDARWIEGGFDTAAEEVFGLRDHVLVRLALFNPYAAASKEVQAKKGQVDW